MGGTGAIRANRKAISRAAASKSGTVTIRGQVIGRSGEGEFGVGYHRKIVTRCYRSRNVPGI
jgi:hypothetical protein